MCLVSKLVHKIMMFNNRSAHLLKTIRAYLSKLWVVTNRFFSELFTTQKRISTWCHCKQSLLSAHLIGQVILIANCWLASWSTRRGDGVIVGIAVNGWCCFCISPVLKTDGTLLQSLSMLWPARYLNYMGYSNGFAGSSYSLCSQHSVVQSTSKYLKGNSIVHGCAFLKMDWPQTNFVFSHTLLTGCS